MTNELSKVEILNTCENYDPNVGDFRIERLTRDESCFEGMAIDKDTFAECVMWILQFGDKWRTYRVTKYNLRKGVAQEVLRCIPSPFGWEVELNDLYDFELMR